MNPFFKVSRQNLLTDTGIEIPGRQALINEDTGDCLGIVSPNYELVHNEKVAALFENAFIDYPIAKKVDHLNGDGRKWSRMILFDKDEFNFEVKPDDKVGVMVSLFNGYDGSTSFGFEISGYRWVCENGMVLGKEKIFKETFTHFEDSRNRLVESFEMKFEKFKENLEIWKNWVEIPMPHEEFVEFIDSRDYVKSDKIKEQIISYYPTIKDKEELDETVWLAFNVITYVMTHVTKARRGSNVFSNRYKTMNRIAQDLYKYEMIYGSSNLIE